MGNTSEKKSVKGIILGIVGVIVIIALLLALPKLTGSYYERNSAKITNDHKNNTLENVLKNKNALNVSMVYRTSDGNESRRSFYIEKSKNSYNIYENLSSSDKVYYYNNSIYYNGYIVCYADATYDEVVNDYFTDKLGFDGFNQGSYMYENIGPYSEELWYFVDTYSSINNNDGSQNAIQISGDTTTVTVEIKDNTDFTKTMSKYGYKDIASASISYVLNKDGFLTSAEMKISDTAGNESTLFTKEYSYEVQADSFVSLPQSQTSGEYHQLTIYQNYGSQDVISRRYQVESGRGLILTAKNSDLKFYYDSLYSMAVSKGAVLNLRGDAYVFAENDKNQQTGIFGIIASKAEGYSNANPGSDGKLSFIQSYLENFYYQDIDNDEISTAIYKAILSNIGDKYASYMTPEELKKKTENDSGEYVGIGCKVGLLNDGRYMISEVYENSPSEAAGLKVGDCFILVENEEIAPNDLEALVQKLKGQEGTKVNITIDRNGEKINLELTRAKIESETVTSEYLDNNIGLIRIKQFEQITSEQVKRALEEMNSKGVEALILDLRGNPGGLMTTVIDILNMFISEGELFSSSTKTMGDSVYNATGNAIWDKPVVCLIDQDSASAAELLSGSLKSNGIASLIGKTTYGKGIIQNTFSLPDGSGIKFTVGEYKLPGGVAVHEIGVSPDIEVDLPVTETGILRYGENDTQFKRALEVLSAK